MAIVAYQPLSVLLVLCHPVAHSLCSHLANRVQTALQQTDDIACNIVNLYHTNIDVILTAEEIARKWPWNEVAQQHIDLVRTSSVLIFIHPDWWGAPPALLLGWIQKIFIPHIAFRFQDELHERQHPYGLFGDKSLYIINTTDSEEQSSSVQSLTAWWHHIATYSNVKQVVHHIIPNVKSCTKALLVKKTSDIIEELLHRVVDPLQST